MTKPIPPLTCSKCGEGISLARSHKCKRGTARARHSLVRSSKLVGELEAALRICKDLESASREHGMWGYEDDWNALMTFISQRLDSERGRSPTKQLYNTNQMPTGHKPNA